jgi:hypothetical protein
MVSAITTLVGEELQGDRKWRGTVAAPNGSIYGIPNHARRVAKFNPLDKSIAEIGPDFGDDGWGKWCGGAMTDSGVIYCPLSDSDRGILKIDTNTDNVTELDANLLPERGHGMWASCALALDGCIYFMPHNANHMMKLDPNNNDAMSSIGDGLGDERWKYSGTVIGIDGCVYGIPDSCSRIVKYDPINDITSFVGEEADEDFDCHGNGVLGRDGCIYAANKDGQVLKIDSTNNFHCIVGNTVELDLYEIGWRDAILGMDGCIYWPPYRATQILKYDPHSNLTSLVGDHFEFYKFKWSGGCAAPDGVIYCLPSNATRILTIDPLKEYTLSLKNHMEEHPEKLGCFFHSSDDIPDDTNFDRAVTKFGKKKVLELLEECMPPIDRVCTVVNLYPFIIAASFKNSNVSVIYHLLRQMPSFANCSNHFSDV